MIRVNSGAASTGETRAVSARITQSGPALHPAYFALVMATGIVALAAFRLGLPALASMLLGLNVVFYVVLWGLTLLRCVGDFPAVARDLADHNRAVGFFTIPAATGVLGSQALLQAGNVGLASVLGWLTFALWLLVVYAVFFSLIVKPVKPPLELGINGGWLVCAVATQSTAIMAIQLAPISSLCGASRCRSSRCACGSRVECSMCG